MDDTTANETGSALGGSVQNQLPRSASTQDVRRQRAVQELLTTERNYVDDLLMVAANFRQSLLAASAIDEREAETLFGNWDQLIDTGKQLFRDMTARPTQLGAVLCEHEQQLTLVFTRFCGRQQAAVDLLTRKEANVKDTKFSATYAKCCSTSVAGGLTLTHYLLLPMTRVTKYPLVVQELLKYTESTDADYANLTAAHSMLRELCAQVNQVVRQSETTKLLQWCEERVKYDAQTMPVKQFQFDSMTNAVGRRQFVHGGVVYKAKSGRLLVGLLFNDMLMLTTPDQTIADPIGFNIVRAPTALKSLHLYKQPLLLHKLSIVLDRQLTGQSGDDHKRCFTLAYDSDDIIVHLRCVDLNARTLWTRQLQTAIDYARASVPPASQSLLASAGSTGAKNESAIGRLLLELVAVRHLAIPTDTPYSCVQCRLQLHTQTQLHTITLTSPTQSNTSSQQQSQTSLCTTQFTLPRSAGGGSGESVQLDVLLHRDYSPDVLAGRAKVALREMITASGSHRGPIVRQVPLTDSQLPPAAVQSSFVIIKFVVQLFDNI